MDKILILGAKGMLGGELLKVFGRRAIGWDREDCDLLNAPELQERIESLKPEAVINCAAFNDVDGAEDRPEAAYALNAEAVKNLADICKGLNIPLMHFSTNYVFSGKRGEYAEDAVPDPVSVYGQSKRQGEIELQKQADKFWLVRTAALFGPKGQSELSKKSFVELMLDLAAKNPEVKAVADEINSLTYAPDLARAAAELVNDKKPFGVYHITNSGFASWYDFAKEIFAQKGLNAKLIKVPGGEFKRKASRPAKSVLLNTKLPSLRSWREALREFLIFGNQMKGIILSGGSGTRLSPLTKVTSKQLLPVYNKPMIFYPLQTLLKAGIKEILIIVAPERAGDYLRLLGSGKEFGAKFTYEIQDKPEGLAQAFVIGADFIGSDNVCMILGDNIFEEDFSDTIRNFKSGALIFAAKVPDPERSGVVVFDENNKAVKIVEKPKEWISDYAIPGLYIYDNRVCEVARQVRPSARGELEITDLHNWYLEKGELSVEKVKGEWVDAGTFESLFKAGELARKKALQGE